MAVTWLCPRCRRRVPRREAACFCGCPREQAEREAHEEHQRSAAQPTRELALMLALIGLIALLFARQRLAPPPEPGPEPPAAVATVSRPVPTPPSDHAGPALTPGPHRPAHATPEPAPPLPPVPTPATPSAASAAPPVPATPPASEAARLALRSAYGALASEASRLERLLTDYQALCQGPHVGVVVSNCDQLQGWLSESARRVQDGLAAAEEQARRERALPGDVRALREEMGVARWEALAGRALATR